MMNRRELLAAFGAFALPAGLSGAPAKSRLRSAICAYSFRDALAKRTMTYEDIVKLCVELDVDGIDMTVYWFPSTSDSFLLPLRRAAYRSGVEIYSISIRTEMTQPKPDNREKEAAAIRGWVDVAEKLGAGHIRVFGGDVPSGAREDEAAGWVVDTLQRSVDYAGSKGVILGLENHGGITERAARVLEIVKRVDSPWVGINLDTGNFTDDVYSQIGQCLPYAVNVQVKAEMRGPGGAMIRQDWPKMIGMIRESGYKGFLALEYEANEDAATAVPRLIRELQQIISRPKG